jgi:hypothetical protein
MRKDGFDHLMALYRMKDKERLPDVSTDFLVDAVLHGKRGRSPSFLFALSVQFRQAALVLGLFLILLASALYLNARSPKEEQIAINITGSDSGLAESQKIPTCIPMKEMTSFSFTYKSGKNIAVKL